ncbi:glycosyltransferase [Clostridium guangxiense]|uniref:glycosyltransferase n=1 Tax=Clostridium guangxiense TaxID=1662055 RepID=UPI001E308D88|nr:glycosyltransferase family 4 protein [Clostridium guangxiense]MCD2347504.1 glycosyltransferase family 4 protein [Clostridium guangxiense]
MERKKVLFITTRLIYPTNSGRKVVLYNYCKGLKEIYNCDVYLFSFLEDGDKVESGKPDFIKELYLAHQPNKIEKLKNLIYNSIILQKWPLQVSLYYSKSTYKKLLKLINELKPDILICDMARTAEYIRNLNLKKTKKVLDMDDLISKRYYRQIQLKYSNHSALGMYSRRIPKILKMNKLINIVLKIEYKLLNKYEKSLKYDFDKIIFVSPIEAKSYNESNSTDKAISVTIGVDYNYYSSKVVDKGQDKLIGFLGNMYVSHNKDAVDYFLKKIFPIVKEKVPDAKFIIVGKCSDEYKKAFNNDNNIQVTGEVVDIRKYIQKCSVVIAPLTYGSGIKTKILETMAMGVPVVTNSIGAEGINVENSKDIFVENNDEDFSYEVVNLLLNDKLNKLISKNAQQFILCNHTWKYTLANFDYILL